MSARRDTAQRIARRVLLLVAGVMVAALAVYSAVVSIASYRSLSTMILLPLWLAGLGYFAAGFIARAMRTPE